MIEDVLYCLQQTAEIFLCEDCKNYNRCDHTLQKELAEYAIEVLKKQIPEKINKTNICSQSCPVCDSSVNGNYCTNCGQALKY